MKTNELIEAIQKGDSRQAAALLDEDRALLNAKSGNTPAVLLALYHGHPEIAQLFIERGLRLSFAEACALGDRKRAMELLEKDSDLVRSYSEDGYPAVGLAIFFRHPEIVRELIERGADVNAHAKNPQRVAPVHSAATVQDYATMKLLLEHGADPNARQQMGYTALHTAASHGDVEMAKLLMQHGADAHARTEDGMDAAAVAEKYKQPAFADWFRKNY